MISSGDLLTKYTHKLLDKITNFQTYCVMQATHYNLTQQANPPATLYPFQVIFVQAL